MTQTVDPLTEFDALRRAGVSYSQEASGEIWTDYNVHDPGVTLLEQTCFLLSQIAYQVGLPTRDLLTNPRGHFCFQDLALFRPRKVLDTRPVTSTDLTVWLNACAGIETVSITPPDTGTGLYDVTIVPSPLGEAEDDQTGLFRAAFADVRPLCTDLGKVEVASKVMVRLAGDVEVSSDTLPETAAAHLYRTVAEIVNGSDHDVIPATRADVWDAPERLLMPPADNNAQSLDVSKHLARLRNLPGLRDIGRLSLQVTTSAENAPAEPVYYEVEEPGSDAEIHLNLTLNGAPVTLSAARLNEEFIRISAQAIAEASHHIDRIDWEVMKPGRRRRFTHSHVDSLLPTLYRAHGYRTYDPDTLVAEYRGAIDDVLRDMVNTLDALPRTFTATPRVSRDDPVLHRRRVELLDYLIALQGVEMPASRHSGLHKYMTTRARHRFDIEWRLEYLFALPTLHSARATGPGPVTPGGFLAELAILCDLDLSESGMLTRTLDVYGLTLADNQALTDDPEAEKFTRIPPHNMFDMLVPEQDDAPLLSPDDLKTLSGFIDDGKLSPDMLIHLAQSDSFAILPAARGQWVVLLDPGAGRPLRQIGVGQDKYDALRKVARLRATWRHLNRNCEAAHLIEHVLLGGSGTSNVADLILPRWTARCQMESYRSYVDALVQQLAPAHIHVRLHWLSYPEMRRFEALKKTAQSGDTQDLGALRDYLNDQVVGGQS